MGLTGWVLCHFTTSWSVNWVFYSLLRRWKGSNICHQLPNYISIKYIIKFLTQPTLYNHSPDKQRVPRLVQYDSFSFTFLKHCWSFSPSLWFPILAKKKRNHDDLSKLFFSAKMNRLKVHETSVENVFTRNLSCVLRVPLDLLFYSLLVLWQQLATSVEIRPHCASWCWNPGWETVPVLKSLQESDKVGERRCCFPHVTDGKLKHGECKWLAHGRKGSLWQTWEMEPKSFESQPSVLTTRPLFFRASLSICPFISHSVVCQMMNFSRTHFHYMDLC